MILSKDGVNVISIGENDKRVIKDSKGNKRVLHSLGSCNYLKIEKTNHLYFACQFYDDRQVCLQEQYNDTSDYTRFDDIYRIKIHEMTLREILIIQSIYGVKKISDIELLVEDQPNPSLFFKVFLDIGLKCFTVHLAFDNRSIDRLLDKKNQKYFDEEYPIFYKNED